MFSVHAVFGFNIFVYQVMVETTTKADEKETIKT